jgi:hypothetical protein
VSQKSNFKWIYVAREGMRLTLQRRGRTELNSSYSTQKDEQIPVETFSPPVMATISELTTTP